MKKKYIPRNVAKTKLKKLRLQKGVKQKEAIAEMEITSSSYTNFETGISYVDTANITTILKIANYYNVDLSDLLENEENIKLWNKYKREVMEGMNYKVIYKPNNETIFETTDKVEALRHVLKREDSDLKEKGEYNVSDYTVIDGRNRTVL